MAGIKKILLLLCLISTIKLNATDAFTIKHSNSSDKEEISIGRVFTVDEQLSPFLNSKQIIGFAINGTLTKKSADYYARILLCDKNGDEFLVLELYEEINNKEVLSLLDYCEETMILDNIQPESIKIMLRGAEMRIDNFTCLLPKDGSLLKDGEYQKEWKSRKRNQVERIVEKINSYNYENRRLWGADITEISMLPWSKKNKLLGIGENTIDGRGFEYYARGIFEFERKKSKSGDIVNQPLRNMAFPVLFDWRDRHGKCWLTSVKDQYPGSGCWAFATVGVTEAIAKLYYNQELSWLNLSEQEVISCSNCGTNANGGHPDQALQWIADNGISEEDAFVFENADLPCSNKNGNYQQLWRFHDAVEVPIGQNKEDSIKKYLVQKGPMASGYPGNPGYSMVLVGFKTIQVGDVIQIYGGNPSYTVEESDNHIKGRTYWIFKNSYGLNQPNEHAGYVYMYFANLDNMLTPYYAETPVYSITPTSLDVVCEDADGDGYYFWGIGQKPENCPYWVPVTPDGNDNDINIGRMDPLGNMSNIYPLGETINYSTTYNTDTTLNKRIGIVRNGVLTITSTIDMSGGGRIRVCEGGTLIVDGGTLQNADLNLIPGSSLILRNNGKIYMDSVMDFEAPEGVVVNIESGEIN